MSYINGKRIIKSYIPTYLDLDTVYPVGSVYISVNSTSPASLFGGTWQRINSAFLYGTGNDANIGQTGGEETHTLLQSELPASMEFKIATSVSGSNPYGPILMYGDLYADRADRTYIIVNENGGQAHNNMPPYVAVAIWKRTA